MCHFGRRFGLTGSLTTSADNITGTSSNDVINGFAKDGATAGDTLSSADIIDGGAGADTLSLTVTGTFAGAPSIKNVETLAVRAAAAASIAADAGYTTIKSYDGTNTATFTGIANNATIVLSNNGTNAQSFTFANSKLASASAELSIQTEKMGSSTTAAALTVDVGGTDVVKTLNVAAAGTTNNMTLKETTAGAFDTLTKLVITGSGGATIASEADAVGDADGNGTLSQITTVDASANTGGVSVDLETGVNAKDVTFTGGTGDDKIKMGAGLTKADKLDGGTGTNTLSINQTSVTAVNALSSTDKDALNAAVSNFSKLEVSNGLTSDLDMSRYDSMNYVVLTGGNNAAGTATISKVTSGVTVEINAAAGAATNITAISVTDASLAGNNSDTVNLVLKDTTDGATDLGVVDLVGVDIVNIAANDVGTNSATAYTLDIKNSSTALDKVVVTGTADLDLSVVALTNSIAEVDASAATGIFKVSIATGGTSGVVIKGTTGTAVNTLTGGDGGDIITANSTAANVLVGNAGDDTITGAGGADTLTGNAGSDTLTGAAGADIFNFDTTEAQIIGSANADKIKDFVAGTDKLQFGKDAGDVFAGQTNTSATLGTQTTITTSVASLADIITAIGTQTAVTAGGALKGSVYVFTTGAAAGTYLHLNDDGTAAADAADVFINLTGITGTLTATDFSFV